MKLTFLWGNLILANVHGKRVASCDHAYGEHSTCTVLDCVAIRNVMTSCVIQLLNFEWPITPRGARFPDSFVSELLFLECQVVLIGKMLVKVFIVAFLVQAATADTPPAKRQVFLMPQPQFARPQNLEVSQYPQYYSQPQLPQLPGAQAHNLQADDSICHPEPTADAPQHFIAYGPLINEEAKNAAFPGAGESVPVRVRGLSRHWNFQNRTTGLGHTQLGSAINAAGTINAVAFTIPPGDNITETLLAHDERKKEFCRQRVPAKSITTFITKESNALEDGDYWVYVTRSEYATTPNTNYPIVQSYVDEFLIGCLEIGKKFDIPEYAEECVESTYGWEMTWVNDRVYPRRPEMKQPHAREIDAVLAKKSAQAFSRITIE